MSTSCTQKMFLATSLSLITLVTACGDLDDSLPPPEPTSSAMPTPEVTTTQTAQPPTMDMDMSSESPDALDDCDLADPVWPLQSSKTKTKACFVTLTSEEDAQQLISWQVDDGGTIRIKNASDVVSTEAGEEPHRDQTSPVLTACGADSVFAGLGDHHLTHFNIQPDGTLKYHARYPLDHLVDLQCDTNNQFLTTLQVATFDPENPQLGIPAQVTAWSIGDDGSLSRTSAIDILFAPSTPIPMLHNASILSHPITKEIWVMAAYNSRIRSLDNGQEVVRLKRTDDGTLAMQEGPTKISHDGYAESWHFNDDGTTLSIAGFSGGCFAWFNLSAPYTLPHMDTLDVVCGPPWSASNSAATQVGSNVFYVTSAATTGITVAAFTADTVVRVGQTADAMTYDQLMNVGDEPLLLSINKGGAISTFHIADDASLTKADHITLWGAATASTKVPCPLPTTTP